MMTRITAMSWRHVWSFAVALALAVLLAGTLAQSAAAAPKKGTIEYLWWFEDRLIEECTQAGGTYYGSAASGRFGCILDGWQIEC